MTAQVSNATRRFLGLSAVLVMLTASSVISAATPVRPLPDLPRAERLSYDVRVFGLIHAVRLEVDFHAIDASDLFEGTLRIIPQGLIRTLSRVDRMEYRSRLRALSGEATGRRLRLERLEKRVIGKRDYRGVYDLHYDSRTVVGQGVLRGRELARETFQIPPGEDIYFDDFLSFFYNLRFGGYIALKDGGTATLRSLPPRPENVFSLTRDLDAERSDPTSSVLRVAIEREFLGMELRSLWLWLGQDNQIREALARDVVGWGDVKGRLNGTQEEPPREDHLSRL